MSDTKLFDEWIAAEQNFARLREIGKPDGDP